MAKPSRRAPRAIDESAGETSPREMAACLLSAGLQVSTSRGRQFADWELLAERLRAAAELIGRLQRLATSPWMTTEEAADYARCSPRTLEDLRREGGGPEYNRQSGRLVYYHRDDVDAWRRRGRASHTTQERIDGVPLR